MREALNVSRNSATHTVDDDVFARNVSATAATVRRTSASLVRQFTTLTRIARRPRQVVPLKNASPPALIAAIVAPVHRS